jgi:cytochrome c biogenesis protein CcmG, thiol:disulfide interchange protein DsbE
MLRIEPSRRGWGRPAVGLAFVVALSFAALLSAKLALDAGRLTSGGRDGGGTASASNVPGVLSKGQFGITSLRDAPAFTMRLFSGGDLELASLHGKPVVLNFWASWCGPCREEAAVLQRLWLEYEVRGVVFLGVDVWDDERAARRFMQEFGVTYPSGQDPRGRIARSYGVTGVPETYLIDREGRLTHRWLGPWSEAALRGALDELVGRDGR